MRFFLIILFLFPYFSYSQNRSAYDFLRQKSTESKKEVRFNEYEDIISGSIAFAVGNIGYFTTDSSTLKIAYSGVQTVGIIAVGHGIYDYYYPHFEDRLLKLLSKKKMTRGQLADGYVSLLGEMDRAKRLSILWSSSLLTVQYALNSFLGKDVPSDLKDIYFFLGGVNAIIASYSLLSVSDYESYYLQKRNPYSAGLFIIPDGKQTKTGLGITYRW